MERTVKGNYTLEIRAEAAELVETTGMSEARSGLRLRHVPRRLGATGGAALSFTLSEAKPSGRN